MGSDGWSLAAALDVSMAALELSWCRALMKSLSEIWMLASALFRRESHTTDISELGCGIPDPGIRGGGPALMRDRGAPDMDDERDLTGDWGDRYWEPNQTSNLIICETLGFHALPLGAWSNQGWTQDLRSGSL